MNLRADNQERTAMTGIKVTAREGVRNKKKQDADEHRRYKGRLDYYRRVLGMSEDEAVRRASGGGKVAAPNPEPSNGDSVQLTAWQKRQQARKKGQLNRMESSTCPKCESKFLVQLPGDANPNPVKLNYCPICKVRFYFAELTE